MNKNWTKETRIFVLSLVLIISLLIAWYIRELFGPLIIGALIAYLDVPICSISKETLQENASWIGCESGLFFGIDHRFVDPCDPGAHSYR